jgi:hypothetical protein
MVLQAVSTTDCLHLKTPPLTEQSPARSYTHSRREPFGSHPPPRDIAIEQNRRKKQYWELI